VRRFGDSCRGRATPPAAGTLAARS
jgi:hypothetical protein